MIEGGSHRALCLFAHDVDFEAADHVGGRLPREERRAYAL